MRLKVHQRVDDTANTPRTPTVCVWVGEVGMNPLPSSTRILTDQPMTSKRVEVHDRNTAKSERSPNTELEGRLNPTSL